jgi:hypothetical protein
LFTRRLGDTMENNAFDDLVRADQERMRQSSQELFDMLRYLDRIELDTEGTDPSDIFTEEEAQLMADFIEFAGRYDYNLAQSWELEVTSPPRFLTESEAKYGPGKEARKKSKGFFSKESWETIWSGQGYVIGQMYKGMPYFNRDLCPVVLCTDGKVRTQRTPTVFPHTKSHGIGTVPRHDHLEAAINIGYIDITKSDAGTDYHFNASSVSTMLNSLALKIANNC